MICTTSNPKSVVVMDILRKDAALRIGAPELATISIGAYQGALTNNPGLDYFATATAAALRPSGPLSTRADFPDAVTTIRTILAAAADASIVYCIGGSANSWSDFLESPADGISPLTGHELAAAKVMALIPFMGTTAAALEANFYYGPPSGANAFYNSPVPVRHFGGPFSGPTDALVKNASNNLNNPWRYAWWVDAQNEGLASNHTRYYGDGYAYLAAARGRGGSPALFTLDKYQSMVSLKDSSGAGQYVRGTYPGQDVSLWTVVASGATQTGIVQSYIDSVTETALLTTPGADTLSVTGSNTQNRVAWTAGSDGGSALADREVEYSLTDGFAAGTGTLVANELQAAAYVDHTGLTNGTPVYYHSRVRNAQGWGRWSDQATGTPAVVADYITRSKVGWFEADAALATIINTNQVSALTNKVSGNGNLTAGGTQVNLTYATGIQNSLPGILFTRTGTSSTPRLVALATDAISTLQQASDKAFVMAMVFRPTDTNTGYVFSWSDWPGGSDTAMMALVRRNTASQSVRKQSLNANQVDVSAAVSWPSGTARIVLIYHTGTAVTVYDNGTKIINAGAQDLPSMPAVKFALGAALAATTWSTVNASMYFHECLIGDLTNWTEAQLVQAGVDLNTKWAVY